MNNNMAYAKSCAYGIVTGCIFRIIIDPVTLRVICKSDLGIIWKFLSGGALVTDFAVAVETLSGILKKFK